MAQDGVIFDNAYFAVSICRPSRVTMLTGQYFSTHRFGFVYPNNYTLSRNRLQQTYPALLKAQGYRTGFVGKMGFRMTENGSRESSGKDTYQRHLSGIFDYFWGESTHSYSQDYWPQNDSELAAAFAQKDQPGQRTWMKGRAALRFLDTQAADQPFCLSISFDAVKHDRDAHVYMPHYEKFKHKNFPIPDNWVEGMNEKLPNVVRHGRGIRLHQQRTSTKELYLNQVRRFATQGYTVDLQVGRLMEKLKEKGLLKIRLLFIRAIMDVSTDRMGFMTNVFCTRMLLKRR